MSFVTPWTNINYRLTNNKQTLSWSILLFLYFIDSGRSKVLWIWMPTFQVNHDKLLQLSSHITYGSRGIIPVMVGQLDFLGRTYFLALNVYYVGINKDVVRKKVTGTAAVLYKNENLLWSMFYWHGSCHNNVMTPLRFFTCLCISWY